MKARYEVLNLGSKDGFAMMAALGVLTLLSVLVVTVFANAMASFRSGMTDLEKSRTYYAAGAESGMAQLALALEDAVIEDQELSAIVPPTIDGFVFDEFSIVRDGSVETERITDGPYVRAKSDASFDNRVKTNAYEVDSLKVPLPDGMSAIAVMQPRLVADGALEKQAKFSWKADWYIEVDMGAISENSGTTFPQVLTSIQFYIDAYGGNIGDKLEQAHAKATDALGKYLIPDESGALSDLDGAKGEVQSAQDEGLPGSEAGDLTSQINQLQAFILSGGNANAGGNGSGSMCSIAITHTRPVGLNSPSSAQCSDIFSFTADKWYEGREQRYVDIIDVNVASLSNWADGNANRATSLMYITITNTNGAMDPAGDGIYPVVRLTNANKLLAPMTFSTNHPLYTWGDYNTDPLWYPSALVADALTFLSGAWSDDQHQDPVQIRPIAADTDIYAAVMAGHSGTPCDHEVGGCGITSPYGGGLENFPRFLEDWNPEILMFRGSLVSLSFAQQATGLWGNGPYYRPPVRDWEFDTRFDQPENMPPGTPVVGNVIHTAFRPVF